MANIKPTNGAIRFDCLKFKLHCPPLAKCFYTNLAMPIFMYCHYTWTESDGLEDQPVKNYCICHKRKIIFT